TSALPRLATEERTSQIGSEGPNADILTRQEMINVPGLPIVMGPRWNVCQFRRRAHCIQIFRSIFVVWVCLVISASYGQDVDGNQPARPWLRKASVDLAGKLRHWRLTFALVSSKVLPRGKPHAIFCRYRRARCREHGVCLPISGGNPLPKPD